MNRREAKEELAQRAFQKREQLAVYGIVLPDDLSPMVFNRDARIILEFIESGNYQFGSVLSAGDRAFIFRNLSDKWVGRRVAGLKYRAGSDADSDIEDNASLGIVSYILPARPHEMGLSMYFSAHDYFRNPDAAFRALVKISDGRLKSIRLSSLVLCEV